MSCEWVREHIDEYELGGLGPAETQRLEAHLASCTACRDLQARARAVDEAIRAALAWAEPGATFAHRLAARARRPARARWAAVAAAAAAVALAVLFGLTGRPAQTLVTPTPAPPAERLLAGRLCDAYGLPAQHLEAGLPYLAASNTAIDIGQQGLFLLARGTRFTSAGDPGQPALAVSLLSGTLLGQVSGHPGETAVDLAPELGGAIGRTRACQFYATGLRASLLTQGHTLANWPEDIRIYVFSGKLDLDLGAQRLALLQGDSIIISGGATAGATRAVDARVRELRAAVGEDMLGQRHRYYSLIEQYGRRLLQLRATPEQHGLPYLAERIELVRDLLDAHMTALMRLVTDHPDFYELDAAEQELHRLDRLRDEANDALERLAPLVDAAG